MELWRSTPFWSFYWLTRLKRETSANQQVTCLCLKACLHPIKLLEKYKFCLSNVFPESEARLSTPSTANAEVKFISISSIFIDYIFTSIQYLYPFIFILSPGLPRWKQPPLCCFKCQCAQQIQTTEEQQQQR